MTRTAESLLSPRGTVFLLIPAVPGAALAAGLAAVDVHVLRVRVTLALPGPGAAPHIVVVALHVALVAGHWALGQHPPGVAVTLTQLGPCSTVSRNFRFSFNVRHMTYVPFQYNGDFRDLNLVLIINNKY